MPVKRLQCYKSIDPTIARGGMTKFSDLFHDVKSNGPFHTKVSAVDVKAGWVLWTLRLL